MAEHTESTMSAADFADHERTYDGFMRMSAVALVWVLCIMTTLAIGGTTHRWVLGGFWLFVATIASVLGLAIRGLDWKPGVVVLVVMLTTLLMITH
ncbi:MAG: aa3-type cytochrome c oxidase subunit IV [Bradyrhizobium sp.]